MLKTRVLAALVFVPVILACIYFGQMVLAAACLVMSLLMYWEYTRLLKVEQVSSLNLVGYIATAAWCAAAFEWVAPSIAALLVPATVIALFLATLARPEPLDASIKRTAQAFFGVAYCGSLIVYLWRLRSLEQGLALCLMALFCTWASDTGAYFAGRALGRRKLYPKISPAKTVEGGIGGWFASVLVALLVAKLFSLSIGFAHLLILGTLAAFFGTVGDLCESMLKRSVGAKDSSNLIPGHGGFLDRFDAAMFVMPAFYAYATLILR